MEARNRREPASLAPGVERFLYIEALATYHWIVGDFGLFHAARAAAILLCVLAPLRASATTNLVSNPSLEQADPGDPSRPADFETDDWGAVSGSFDYLADGGADGSRYVRTEVIEADGPGDAKWMTAPFAVPTGGGLFEIALFYRASVESELLVQALDADGESTWLFVKHLPPASDWTRGASVVTLPESTVQIRVVHVVWELGWAESDSFWASQISVDETSATVTITTDDGWLSMYEHAFPVMEELGIRGSHYMITGFIDELGYEQYMTSAQMVEMANAGHEIGSHSLVHDRMTEISSEELHQNIFESYADLESYGLNVAGFVPPNGAYNQAVIDEAEKRFSYLRTVEAGLNIEPYNTYELNAFVVVNTTTIEQLDSWYKEALANDGWMILLYHRFSEEAPLDTFVTPTAFREQMEYLKSMNAEILPLGEVLGVWTPQSDVPVPGSPDDDPPPSEPWPDAGPDAPPEPDDTGATPDGPFARCGGCTLTRFGDIPPITTALFVAWLAMVCRWRRR